MQLSWDLTKEMDAKIIANQEEGDLVP